MAYHRANEVIQRWIDVTEGRSKEKLISNPNTPIINGGLYSYGRHFELGRPLRSRSGKVKAYVLNGDTARATGGWQRSATPGQQWYLREHVTLPKVIIPFTALEEAGVDLNSIQIIEVTKDRWEKRKHHADTLPEGAVWHEVGIYKEVEKTPEEIASYYQDTWGVPVPTHVPHYIKYDRVKVGFNKVLRTTRRDWSDVITVTRDADGKATSYDWETNHHWLGQSLIRARIGYWGKDSKSHFRWTHFLSGFDHQEPAPLYFLCELPRGSKPATVAEAYEILKPEPVKLAEQMDRRVTRQGDIFAVPAPTLDRRKLEKMGATFEKRGRQDMIPRGQGKAAALLNTNHVATEVARLPNGLTLARGCLYHDPWGRQKDHVRRRIGDGQGWHIILKNTVPVGRR